MKNDAQLTGDGLFVRIRIGSSVSRSHAVLNTTADLQTDSAASGWERVYVTANVPEANTSVTVELVSAAASGSTWFACPQLEPGSIANHVNLLLNGDFTRTYASGDQVFASDWSVSSGISTNVLNGIVPYADAALPAGISGNAMRIHSYCNTGSSSHCQTINIKGDKGDVIIIGGWVNATSVASGGNHLSHASSPGLKRPTAH